LTIAGVAAWQLVVQNYPALPVMITPAHHTPSRSWRLMMMVVVMALRSQGAQRGPYQCAAPPASSGAAQAAARSMRMQAAMARPLIL
jgi:hypothetical protein